MGASGRAVRPHPRTRQNCAEQDVVGDCVGVWQYHANARATISPLAPNADGTEAKPEKRRMEKFCEGPLFRLLQRFRFPLVIFWVAFTIGMVISAATGLSEATKPPDIGNQEQDMVRIFTVLLEEFSFSRTPVEVSMVFGMHGEEPVDYGQKRESDKAAYSSAGAEALTSPEGQVTLLQMCRAVDSGEQGLRCTAGDCLVRGTNGKGTCRPHQQLAKRGIYAPDDVLCQTGRYCFMEEFARYWAWNMKGGEATDMEYPGLPRDTFLAELGGAGFRGYLEAREEALRAYSRAFDVDNYRKSTKFVVNGGKLEFAFVTFNATYSEYTTKETANNWNTRWQAFFDTHGKGQIGGYQTSRLYVFMTTQNELFRAAIQGVCLSLVVAYIVLILTTKNWIIATLGLANILCITGTFIGLLPLIGWEMGSRESIFMIAVVGLSVDYTVHLLHSYNEHEGTREEKASAALGEMGISVVNSAITTLAAAACLFACWFTFFVQFGGFIFFTILFSIFMAIFFLIPTVLIAGPVGDGGELKFLRRKRALSNATDGNGDTGKVSPK